MKVQFANKHSNIKWILQICSVYTWPLHGEECSLVNK